MIELEFLMNSILDLFIIEARLIKSSEEIGETLELILKEEILLFVVHGVKESVEGRIILIEWFMKAMRELDGDWLIHSGIHKALGEFFNFCFCLE